ncbi:MAG: protein kinase [Melioribacter sp.]|nr:protein kinase [Melioribacter sp.]
MTNTSEILFEKFEILDVLKKDEHAAVYLANHIYLSKKIILKVLNIEKTQDQALTERFKREAKLLAKLDHPNIIKVLDFGISKEYFYISFEYIEGESLRNILKSRTLSEEEKKHFTIQLFRALHFAHSNQIIHRDIKPENIFIDKNLNLKLGDFGLALSAEDNFVTSPYSIVGTPSYMSPEQVAGAKLTYQSDLFSAGVVVYEIYTGKNPFLRENVTLTLNEIMSFNENNIVEGLQNVPSDIKEIILKLLKKKTSQRYNSALEVLNDLNVQLEQTTISIEKQTPKFHKKNKVFLYVFILFAVLVAVFLFNKVNIKKDLGSVKQTGKEKKEIVSPKFFEEKTSAGNVEQKINEIKPEEGEKVLVQKDNLESSTVKYGGLFVECYPWADVYIDGEKLETTPMTKPITLTEGEHTIKLVHPDYPIYTNVVKVNHAQVTNLKVSLESLMGFIICKVNPWGNVYVNGDYKGQTPLRQPIKVYPGFVRLTIKNPSFKDVDTSIYIKQGDTVQLKFILTEK